MSISFLVYLRGNQASGRYTALQVERELGISDLSQDDHYTRAGCNMLKPRAKLQGKLHSTRLRLTSEKQQSNENVLELDPGDGYTVLGMY